MKKSIIRVRVFWAEETVCAQVLKRENKYVQRQLLLCTKADSDINNELLIEIEICKLYMNICRYYLESVSKR